MTMTQQPDKIKTIALAAGGSGGHFFPAEALARELTARGFRIVFFTDARGGTYASRLPGARLMTLPAAVIGQGMGGKIKTAWVILQAMLQARRLLKSSNALGLVAFGGYPVFAPALACWLLRKPLVLHEQATKLGLANRVLLPLATKLATSFTTVFGAKKKAAADVVLTGNPVRPEITAIRFASYRAPAASGPLYLLCVGGSQSAKVFGEVIPDAVLQLPDDMRQRLHISLQYKGDAVMQLAQRLSDAGINVALQPFFSDMGERLANAQLVICRAGASTISELLVVGRPAIFVPIPGGGSADEQRRNAAAMADSGAGWHLPQAEFTPENLAHMLRDLFSAPEKLAAAATAAHQQGKPDAVHQLADLVVTTLNA